MAPIPKLDLGFGSRYRNLVLVAHYVLHRHQRAQEEYNISNKSKFSKQMLERRNGIWYQITLYDVNRSKGLRVRVTLVKPSFSKNLLVATNTFMRQQVPWKSWLRWLTWVQSWPSTLISLVNEESLLLLFKILPFLAKSSSLLVYLFLRFFHCPALF